MWVIGAAATVAVAGLVLTWTLSPWLPVIAAEASATTAAGTAREGVSDPGEARSRREHEQGGTVTLDLPPVLRVSGNRALAGCMILVLTHPLFLADAPNVVTRAVTIGAAVVGLAAIAQMATARWLDDDVAPLPRWTVAALWALAAAAATVFTGAAATSKRLDQAANEGPPGGTGAVQDTGHLVGESLTAGWWAGAVIIAVAIWHLRHRSGHNSHQRRAADQARLDAIATYAHRQRHQQGARPPAGPSAGRPESGVGAARAGTWGLPPAADQSPPVSPESITAQQGKEAVRGHATHLD